MFKHFITILLAVLGIIIAIGISFHMNCMQGKECISMALLTLIISNVLVIFDTAHFMFAGEKHSSTAHISTNEDKFKKYRNISLMLNTITLLLVLL